ncbi:LLM class flavin-dependent oxidoreductase [Amycolatopsis jejuensis]|uniref:LLM class flavin-dependent oxidoreductase n=1 Tax=Amycolatopsis jejuensis TaxID=330084 RepID=UPI00052611DB|nr:LLM class flavin-dependent oxidoreductase [Amycolatopsis jejuensis]
MRTGVGLFPTEPVGTMCGYARLAERLGYESVWLGDSQNIWRESSVTLGAIAAGTERVKLGTGVTNAVTRHRSLLASTWATLAEFTGGRACLGIGTGDSSLRTMGLSPLRLGQLEEAITELRALLRGETVTEPTSGAQYHLNYVDEPLQIPIYIAASAPKILELSGRVADGVILLAGTSPDFVAAALDRIEKGARSAGRTLADLDIVLWTPTAIADDPATAHDLVRAHVSRVVIRPLPAEISPSLQSAVDHIRETYNYYEHMDTRADHAGLVPDELVDLFALAGTTDDCLKRLRALEGLKIDEVAIVPFVPHGTSRTRTIEQFADLAVRRATS